MDKAKAAVSDFMSKSGKHDTTVHETVAPAVQEETIKPHHHEKVYTAVDREVHQDHYHRTVQPVKDREILPEKHEAKLGAVQHREVDHRDQEGLKSKLSAEEAQFKDKRVVEPTTHSQSTAPTVGGEHIHHHIHETIQPVVHKETIQPHVTHTTVPIHEVHHNAAQHHSATKLPAMTMDEFKSKGGSLTGREECYDGFEGQPKNIGGPMKDMLPGHHSNKTTSSTEHNASLVNERKHADLDGNDHDVSHAAPVGGTGRDIDGVGGATHGHTVGQKDGVGGTHGHSVGQKGGLGEATHGHTGHKDGLGDYGKGGAVGSTALGKEAEHHHDVPKKEPSLLKKLNPFSDADGDGKKGIMD